MQTQLGHNYITIQHHMTTFESINMGGSSKIQNFMSHDSSSIKIEVYSNGKN